MATASIATSDSAPSSATEKMPHAPVKLAFSTTAVSGWDLSRIIEVGKSLGFDGIELAGVGDGSAENAALLNSAGAFRSMVENVGMKICAVATSHVLHEPSATAWAEQKKRIAETVGLADSLGAEAVRVFGFSVARGEGRDALIVRVGTRLREIIDAAKSAGSRINILLQNGGSFVTPRELWTILEVGRPRDVGAESAGGICWDVAEAMLSDAHASPTNTVSILNARIKLAHVWDHAGTRSPVPLGTGHVKNKLFAERLRGVGFGTPPTTGTAHDIRSEHPTGQWLVYAPPPAPQTDAAKVEQLLATAATAMKFWTRKAPPPVPTAKPATEKPAAKS